jgi:hypothetical protein
MLIQSTQHKALTKIAVHYSWRKVLADFRIRVKMVIHIILLGFYTTERILMGLTGPSIFNPNVA